MCVLGKMSHAALAAAAVWLALPTRHGYSNPKHLYLCTSRDAPIGLSLAGESRERAFGTSIGPLR